MLETNCYISLAMPPKTGHSFGRGARHGKHFQLGLQLFKHEMKRFDCREVELPGGVTVLFAISVSANEACDR